MVRNVRNSAAETYCCDARVRDVTAKLPLLLKQHPMVKTVLIHAGFNDIKFQQSERLKDDFTCLIDTLLDLRSDVSYLSIFLHPNAVTSGLATFVSFIHG